MSNATKDTAKDFAALFHVTNEKDYYGPAGLGNTIAISRIVFPVSADQSAEEMNHVLNPYGIMATASVSQGVATIQFDGVTPENVALLKQHRGGPQLAAAIAKGEAVYHRQEAEAADQRAMDAIAHPQFSIPLFADPDLAEKYRKQARFVDGNYTFSKDIAPEMKKEMPALGLRITELQNVLPEDRLKKLADAANINGDKITSDEELAAFALASEMITAKEKGHIVSYGYGSNFDTNRMDKVLDDPDIQKETIALAKQILQDNGVAPAPGAETDKQFIANRRNLGEFSKNRS